MIKKKILSIMLMLALVFSGLTPAEVWADEGTTGNISIDALESITYPQAQGQAVIANEIKINPSISEGDLFAGGYIKVDIMDRRNDSSEIIALKAGTYVDDKLGTVVITEVGEISIGGEPIGKVNSHYNGTAGKALRIDFSTPLKNGNFEETEAGDILFGNGAKEASILGWAIRTSNNSDYPYQIWLGNELSKTKTNNNNDNSLDFNIENKSSSYRVYGTDRQGNNYEYYTDQNYGEKVKDVVKGLGQEKKLVVKQGTAAPTYVTNIGEDNVNAKGKGKVLKIGYKTGTVEGISATGNGTGKPPFGSVFGPEAVSDEFNAIPGDMIAFDWRTFVGTSTSDYDDYEVYGFLIDKNNNPTEIMYGRGKNKDWDTDYKKIPEGSEGPYKFRFVAGSYDNTGGLKLGATLYIDNIRLFKKVVDSSVATFIAKHITYENTDVPSFFSGQETDVTRIANIEVADLASLTTKETAKANVDIKLQIQPLEVKITGPTNEVVYISKPPITGTGTPGSTVTVVIKNKETGAVITGVGGTANVDASGNWSFTPNTDLSDGNYTVEAISKEGNRTSLPDSKTITVKTKHTVSFDSQEGSTIADRTINHNDAIGVLPQPTKTGYTFKGWNTQADGKGSTYNKFTKITGDTTLYAQWKKIEEGTDEKEIDKDETTTGKIPVKDLENKITYEIGDSPQGGTAIVDENGNWTYTPDPDSNFTGEDKFTIIVTYPNGDAEEIPVTVIVKDPDTAETTKGNPVDGEVKSSEIPDAGEISYEIKDDSGPENGTATIDEDGNWTYTPQDGFTGEDAFTIVIKDEVGKVLETIQVKVVVVENEDTPVVEKGEIGEGKVKPSKEPEAGEITYKITKDPENGTATVDKNGNWTYDPNPGFTGDDKFTVEITYPNGDKETVTINVTVNKVGVAINMVAEPEVIVANGKDKSTLTATVTDSNGNPVAGVEVKFESEMGTFPNGNRECTAITNENGEAKVVLTSDEFKYGKDDVLEPVIIPVKATVNDEVQGIKGETELAMIFEPSSISGRVIDKDGKPVAGAKVVVKDTDGFENEITTDADGKYKIFIPEGDKKYEVEITKPIIINGVEKDITFKQNATPGTSSGTGKEFAAEKTFTGVIITKDDEGKEKPSGTIGNIPITIKQLDNGKIKEGGKEAAVEADTGIFSIEDLSVGKHEFAVINIAKDKDGNDVELVIGKIEVTITANGEVAIHEELIDPYGTIRDAKTNEIVGGANIQIFYADTPRNNAKGRTPGSLVSLPIIPGFQPNDNANPQTSSYTAVWNDAAGGHGNYAWMVPPEADYYIVAKKAGYQDYTSTTISVEWDIIKHDFEMTPTSSSGGGDGGSSSTPKEEAKKEPTEPKVPETTITDGIELSSDKKSYLEDTTADLTIKYKDTDGNTSGAELIVWLPKGAEVIDAQGGVVEGDTIKWKLDDAKAGELGIKNIVIKLPNISKAEEVLQLKSDLMINGKLLGKASIVNITVFSNRYGNGYHKKYIYGYPDKEFKPDRSITRAEIAVIFARILEIENTVKGEKVYNDVLTSDWFIKGVEASSKRGLFTGYEDGSFRPNQPITRGELAVVIAKYLNLGNNAPLQANLNDINNHWAFNYIADLYRNNVIAGYADGSFKPETSLNRSEAVTMINRMLDRGPLKGIESTFSDVNLNHWANGDVEESTRTHEYYRNTDSSETHVKTYDDQGEFGNYGG